MFDGRDEDPRNVARNLRVATILEGSVRIDGNKVRVTAQLINGEDNFHLWSDTFDRDLVDQFLIQEEIASSVAFNLVGVLQPDIQVVLADARAGSPEAYQYYLQGLSYLRQPPTSETLRSARDLLKRALSADDDYAAAHAALCEVELEQYVLDRASTAIDIAETECIKALEIDKQSRQVRQALGVLYRHTGDYERSEQMFHELLDEHSTPSALVGLGGTFDAQGKYLEAEESFEQAIAMEPGNWHHRMALAEFFYWQCRYEESLRVLHDVIRISPDNVRARLILGAAYTMQNNTEASLRETMKAIEISPSRGAYRDLGWTYHYRGEYGKAVASFQRALELGPNDHATWGSLGETYSQMDGQTDAALLAYARAVVLAEDLLARNPRDWLTMSRLAVYNVMIGAVDEGVEKMKTALANRPNLSDIHFMDAVLQTQLNKNDEALDALERAIELGCYPKKLIEDDPRFEVYKDNERFKSLVSE
jgi:tetratricopeptide (TPR) repeat protein